MRFQTKLPGVLKDPRELQESMKEQVYRCFDFKTSNLTSELGNLNFYQPELSMKKIDNNKSQKYHHIMLIQ